ncbi:hypothetical protein [Deinococcus aquatilis]|uniref:hypothetical protein n=1 Tax=Deinococcus aquatilis TaxID=519440 RepID=UPI00037AEA61|nr:hypothetical protein [Deinococcus aquatilis]
MYVITRLSGTEQLSTVPESRGLRINHDRARAACIAHGSLHHRPALSIRAFYLRRHGLNEIRVIKDGQTIERREFPTLRLVHP